MSTKVYNESGLQTSSRNVCNYHALALFRFAQHWIDNISLPSRQGFKHNELDSDRLPTDAIPNLNVEKGSSHACI